MNPRQVLEQRTVAAVLSGTTWRRVEDAGANRWLNEMHVFAIEQEGQRRLPAYVFDPHGEPYAALAEVIGILAGYRPFQLASWFESISATIGGRRPREILASNPEVVIAAAQSHAAGPQQG
ncbi:hypothetical protein [Paucibacter sp. Y2R2-4]|uniref:hypothetical protein n=1 Tax=Paucibacter sp. Y2R2-4 TaxID=2893553 RepID=UPI0021E3B9A6|nr:hypothetical protein [Paucibacter sp. Y2R2-4]MCV2350807.1 hypothetical protein [Paucibacter sp. Y2R2-4]